MEGLAPEEAAELGRLWRKLVKLFHPNRSASDPIQQATYEKLTAAINHAKDNGACGGFGCCSVRWGNDVKLIKGFTTQRGARCRSAKSYRQSS